MKIKFLIISTLTYCIISSLTACVGDVHCPAFPEKLKVFYPYEKGDTLKFVNTANDTLKLIIEELQMTKAYTFPKKCDCDCEATLSFTTSVDKKFSLSISGLIIKYNDQEGELRCAVIRNYRTTYYSLYTLSMDTVILTDYDNPNSITVKKDIGIENFYDIENDCTWTKIQ